MSAEEISDYVPHNILLTGGCGFIGSHVCKFLVGFLIPVDDRKDDGIIINWSVALLRDGMRNLVFCVLHRFKSTHSTTLSTLIFWIHVHL